MDSLDLQLAHALHLDGRAPFTRIAEVLGVSDQTVARRYRRLRETAALRVVGRLDARRLGHVEWVVRLQCAPGTSMAIATALARRADTSWVRLASGGTEVVCLVRAGTEQDRDALLLDKLPATRQVTAISAHCLLRAFHGGVSGWRAITGALTAQQSAALSAAPPDPAAHLEPVQLEPGDHALLAELAKDGRAANTHLAAATGWHEATVRRRIEHLRATGALFFDLDLDNRLLGYSGTALVWISVEPAHLTAAGRALAEHPEISFAAATTGPANLLGSVVCTDVYALYDYIADRVGTLPGVRGIETTPVLRTVKRTAALGEARRPAGRPLS